FTAQVAAILAALHVTDQIIDPAIDGVAIFRLSLADFLRVAGTEKGQQRKARRAGRALGEPAGVVVAVPKTPTPVCRLMVRQPLQAELDGTFAGLIAPLRAQRLSLGTRTASGEVIFELQRRGRKLLAVEEVDGFAILHRNRLARRQIAEALEGLQIAVIPRLGSAPFAGEKCNLLDRAFHRPTMLRLPPPLTA